MTAGGQFIPTLQELPDSPALADWRCDFLASRGLTLTGLNAIINGWEDEYGEVGLPGYDKVIAVDNYVNGNGNDYIWCPHVGT